MASTEDFGDFGSHFLDSMLEVEMTEEDGEVNVHQSDDPLSSNARDLPPIPQFDLQLHTLSYKDAYVNKKPALNPPIAIRTGAATVKPAPITLPAIPSTPMLVIRSDLLKSNNPTVKQNSVTESGKSVLQTNSVKQSPVLQALLTKAAMSPEIKDEFLQQVFRPEFAKKVYTKQDPPRDLTIVGEEEAKYYESTFQDVSNVQLCKLHCTICDKHIGCGNDIEAKVTIHSMLKVLTCKICHEFYGDGNFPCDDGDHYEIYCRWCGQGGALICCSFCPKVFCKRCVRRNFGRAFLKAIEKASDWACFCCAQKPLWPLRAVCRALIDFIQKKKKDPKASSKDTSLCCKATIITKKPINDTDRNKILMSGGHAIQITQPGKEPVIVTGNDIKNKLVAPLTKAISGNGHLVVKKFSTPIKIGNQNKTVTVLNKPQSLSASSKSSNRNSSVPRNLNSLSSFSMSTLPPIISAPIYHGQTLITPPRQNSVQSKPLNIPCKVQSSQFVKVSVADAGNVDIKRIPVAKLPHNVNGLILRMNFPDNRVQFVRLVSEEECKNDGSSFPMPTFENSDNLDFLEGSLEDSFKLTKMLYERLMKIKEKLNSKTKYTKESVYNSSVKKLSFIYEKARELMKELDDNLLSNFESWKSELDLEKDVHVIDISDDEKKTTLVGKAGQSSIFARKGRVFAQDDDSDMEAVVAAAGGLGRGQRNLRSAAKRRMEPESQNSLLRSGEVTIAPIRARQGPLKSYRMYSEFGVRDASAVLNSLPQHAAAKRRKVVKRGRRRGRPTLKNLIVKHLENPTNNVAPEVNGGDSIATDSAADSSMFETVEIKQEKFEDP